MTVLRHPHFSDITQDVPADQVGEWTEQGWLRESKQSKQTPSAPSGEGDK